MWCLFPPHSCSLQPEPEWNRPPDVSWRHDVPAGRRGGVCGWWSCAVGPGRPQLPGREPSCVPAPLSASALRLWVRADPGKSFFWLSEAALKRFIRSGWIKVIQSTGLEERHCSGRTALLNYTRVFSHYQAPICFHKIIPASKGASLILELLRLQIFHQEVHNKTHL